MSYVVEILLSPLVYFCTHSHLAVCEGEAATETSGVGEE